MRYPHKYKMLVETVDTILSDVAQPIKLEYFLKGNGHFVIFIKVRTRYTYSRHTIIIIVLYISMENIKYHLLIPGKSHRPDRMVRDSVPFGS